ncbi:aprataxin [Exophiala aquamarina CBS 119918]|uniref:Aprataxin-like protein n=1 Tax=Exophiala aquamarina CBS 119918 TaxID=1182545 RepID=A0A072P270_9EURO|nr:aprataxin [Exophiala aquamarina CBS 119918]KEF53363.1 aprataxin [Exophiala aquamarina CBS 119918]
MATNEDETQGSRTTANKRKDAFSELMSPKSKHPKSTAITPSSTSKPANLGNPKNALLAYVLRPDRFPEQIITYNENTVLIRDAFPKATLHLLLLPRHASKRDLHPHEAFDDPAFLEMIRGEVTTSLKLAVSELSRLIGPFSETHKARIAAMESNDPPDTLPPGRDFSKELRVGIHAHPSMNHLHIHIVSRDMHSARLKHRKHYNSFNTDFFIPLDDYPLAKDDRRRSISYQNGNLKEDFKCWRCGKIFGNKFVRLKEHLEQEFEAWKQE